MKLNFCIMLPFMKEILTLCYHIRFKRISFHIKLIKTVGGLSIDRVGYDRGYEKFLHHPLYLFYIVISQFLHNNAI